jgi:toxin ParE1/3/4
LNIHWLKRTDLDLEEAFEYLVPRNPRAAWEMLRRVRQRGDHDLRDNPELGRAGRVKGTRELVVTRTKYILVYRIISKDAMQILRVLHSSQGWPPGKKTGKNITPGSHS